MAPSGRAVEITGCGMVLIAELLQVANRLWRCAVAGDTVAMMHRAGMMVSGAGVVVPAARRRNSSPRVMMPTTMTGRCRNGRRVPTTTSAMPSVGGGGMVRRRDPGESQAWQDAKDQRANCSTSPGHVILLPWRPELGYGIRLYREIIPRGDWLAKSLPATAGGHPGSFAPCDRRRRQNLPTANRISQCVDATRRKGAGRTPRDGLLCRPAPQWRVVGVTCTRLGCHDHALCRSNRGPLRWTANCCQEIRGKGT